MKPVRIAKGAIPMGELLKDGWLREMRVLILLLHGYRRRPEEIDGVGGQEAKKVRDYSESILGLSARALC